VGVVAPASGAGSHGALNKLMSSHNKSQQLAAAGAAKGKAYNDSDTAGNIVVCNWTALGVPLCHRYRKIHSGD